MLYHGQVSKSRFVYNGGGLEMRLRLNKPVSDWLELLPLDSTRLNM